MQKDKKSSLFEKLIAPYIDRAIQRKGLYDLHPDLAVREPILRANSEDERANPGTGGYQQNAVSYQTHMWVNKAVNVLANNLSPLSLRVVTGEGAETKYIDNHPILLLLNNPNQEQGAPDLWREWVINMMLGGECGLECVKAKNRSAIVEMWIRNGDVFAVRPESIRYRRVALYAIDDHTAAPYNLLPDEFCHFKFYNPLQPFRGLSPMSAIKYSIIIDQLAQAWTRMFFKNQARPDYAVIAPDGITQTEKRELETYLEQRFGGDGYGAHKPIILESGITDIKTFSFPPKDLEWANQRQFSRDEIGAVFGVPDEIMGYGRDTYENFQTAVNVLWTLTIIPLAGLRDGTLTRFMRKVGMLAINERLETDFSGVSELQEDITQKITQAKTLFDMGTPLNVASDFLGLGLPKVEGGDVGYLPMGLIPAGTTPPAQQPLSLAQNRMVRKSTYREYGSLEHEELYKSLQKRLDPHVAELQRIVKREFQRQQNEINRKLREGKTYGRGARVKVVETIPALTELFDYEAEVKIFMDVMEASVTEMLVSIGDDTLRRLGSGAVLDVNRPEVKAAIEAILETVAKKTNETTWLSLVDLFQAAEDAGEGIPAIQERLSAFFGDRKSDWQTERIARTTMTGASNAGSLGAAQQAEMDIGLPLYKTWLSALQVGRTRDEHADAHGQQRKLTELFDVGGEQLEYPGDPNGSPGNIINCLCTVIYEEV